ncbi:Phenylalanine--tRNA ligase beta subunit [Neolecta irregularis DAH-3]|uniref:Phenylalanine--tRNA ligase beta subunit n=1 Tax=Neolecta irregularis (strain DAH-3) TaxID=1198029 RepID=A0A1U7LPS2_NEOID|nr:Phenylalanine--tRNA ligase beta subunit [Neolecta irregularis DAH-3]|eukprot:OLL24583.1 Phenylalanine--tRNA ligase beta subunit [Neolecta irregularis DAH-3]
MPTVSVDKADLYSALGKQYSTAEFEELCFDFGIELDQDTSLADPATKGLPERPALKIEVPANRYDLLCFEGIARALNTFVGREKPADYTFTEPKEKPLQLIIHQSTAAIRPYAAAAVLRGITFTERRYASFIALQDKLHSNLARNRSLVAIGTHDLSTIKGPFSYEALHPADIKFVPLNQTKEMDGSELMEFYKA